MREELEFCEMRINEATGQGDSVSRMTGLEVIMPLKLKSTMKSLCKMRCIVLAGNS